MWRRDIEFVVAVGIAGAAALCSVALEQAKAQAPPAAQLVSGPSTVVENDGVDFTRPETLIQLRNVFQTAPGNGIVPDTIRPVTTDTLVLRSDLKIDLAPQWTLALRGDLPFVAKNAITADDPTGGYAYGLGDADAQAALIKTIDSAMGRRRRVAHHRAYGHQRFDWRYLAGVADRWSAIHVAGDKRRQLLYRAGALRRELRNGGAVRKKR